MKTLREIIELNGDNYMELVRNGEAITELASEMGYSQCESCHGWDESEAMAITSGMGGHDICDNCLEHKSKRKVVQSSIRYALENQNGNDEWGLKKYLKA